MSSSRAAICWPNQFLVKWLAVLFGAFIIGIVIGALTYKRHPKIVQLHLRAIEIYTDGTQNLIPAEVWIAGHGEQPIRGSYQGKLSANMNDLTSISREAGSDLWLIFRWKNNDQPMKISPWPKSTLTETAVFQLNYANPRKGK